MIRAVENSALEFPLNNEGVAVLRRKIDITAQLPIASADQGRYQEKQMGRNRLVSVHAKPG